MFTKNLLVKSLPVIVFFFLIPSIVSSHCDSVNGPVIKASKKALETGNLNYVLIWVRAEDEKEIQEIFKKVIEVRKLGSEARELADNYFFETVVRIHRMGEGVGYTGLKTADYEPKEGIEAADMAIENNSVDEIIAHINEQHHSKVKKQFADLQVKKNFDIDNVIDGRKYVSAYVQFIHSIEALYNGEFHEEEHHH